MRQRKAPVRRPVTDRVDEGGETIANATGHSSDCMLKQV
jgi:hypothetical protein